MGLLRSMLMRRMNLNSQRSKQTKRVVRVFQMLIKIRKMLSDTNGILMVNLQLF